MAVDGGDPEEPARVLWLQAGEAFADLRVPIDGAGPVEAFAGRTSWELPRLTWHHTLDWRGGFAGYDCGDVHWRGGALVERGTFHDEGGAHEYEEVWDRVDPADQYVVLAAEAAIIVQVGIHSLALRDLRASGGTFDVRAAQWSAGEGWRDTYVFGAGGELPPALVAMEREGWSVTESSRTPSPH